MQDPAAREALLAEVKKYFDEVASLTKEHVTVSARGRGGGCDEVALPTKEHVTVNMLLGVHGGGGGAMPAST